MQTSRRTFSRRRLHIASARSRWASEPGWCMPVSNSTTPSPAAHRPGVAVRDTRPGKRQAQAEDAGQHPFAPPQLAFDRRLRTVPPSIGASATPAETRLSIRRRRGKGGGMAEEESASEAATKVQEAAANVQQASDAGGQAGTRRSRGRDRRAALLRGDRRARPGRGGVRCGRTAAARTCAARWTSSRRRALRAFIGELLEALPDLHCRDRLDDHPGRSLRGAVAAHRHVRRPGTR